ncbi:MAG TPA: hypothetical protein VKC54_01850 [Patescibacteria group bacterium]|nr:hypothetical protein [Patescibacteria group bacterium]
MEANISTYNIKSGESEIPIIYTNRLDHRAIGRMESERRHGGNYITLFVMSKSGNNFLPYFGSCQYDNQLRTAIADKESIKVKLDNQGAPLLPGYAGAVPMSENNKISSIFLNSRTIPDYSHIEDVIKSVVSRIDKSLFLSNTVEAVIERRDKYIIDTGSLKIFKEVQRPNR